MMIKQPRDVADIGYGNGPGMEVNRDVMENFLLTDKRINRLFRSRIVLSC
jgi:hypothetical protein